MTEQRDYRSTVFLPKTDFPMKAGLPQKEPGILARWQAEGLYEQLREARRGREKFILHDGPPYANGDIHVGHALNHILKDMVVRTQSALGKDAPYVPGWDCHGLPIEWKIEEQYRKKKLDKPVPSGAEADQAALEVFRAECRAYAQHWVDVQREQLKRLGINGDWDHPYLTMDPQAEGTIVSELLKFAESGQLYRGSKPVMWSPVEKTALAEAEVEYEDIVSTQIDVAFEIVEAPNCPDITNAAEWCGGVSAVIWTTTPWTIPVNQALSYGPAIEYVLVNLLWSLEDFGGPIGGCYIVAVDLLDQFVARFKASYREHGFDDARLKTLEVNEIARFPGSQLDGASALHPMNGIGGFFARPRPFLPGDFVTTESGTGLVHMAPDHGEDDFALCKAHGIEPVFAVEGDGKYRADWAWLGGQGSVINPKFNAPDGPICSDLRASGGLLAASADYKHSYPHSWRSKAKVIYRCTPQWFVPMDRPLPEREDIALCGYEVEARAEVRGTALRQAQGERELEGSALQQAQGDRESDGGAHNTAQAEPVEAPSGQRTLRQTALAEIERVRFIPDKGRNRIGSMVEGRPDWVLSRQRAWGVPITLFVDRKSGQHLVDAQVNARIVSAIKAEGVDAWSEARAQEYLGEKYRAEDFERVTDILDVWFDSGSTHAFVLESGRWPDLRWPADLYLEGSDQHRGWFQSSLLESCATRGRAPYNAVLTHGFTMDAKGMKMSKSLGNTIDPLKVMETNGADIIRLWALSVDYTEDHRIGDEILKGVADQYRKLRNTFRYLLGALGGFEWESEAVPAAEMPELERYMLDRLSVLDARLREAIEAFDFNDYTRALTDFCNEDLSAFFFDVRKDSLYCDAPDDPRRRAYRTVLDVLFNALVRYAAPVLVFTAEEVWGTRFPERGSVHLQEWHALPAEWIDPALAEKWQAIRAVRARVLEAIEPLRREKQIGSSLQAEIELIVAEPRWLEWLSDVDLAEVFISGEVQLSAGRVDGDVLQVTVRPSPEDKCGRCWRHLPEVDSDGALCDRCDGVVMAMEPLA